MLARGLGFCAEAVQRGARLFHAALLAGEATVGWGEIALGFFAAFVVALVVIRAFVAYVSRRGFAPFAWYRIALGTGAIAWLAFG